MPFRPKNTPFAVGQRWQHSRLGSKAVYRIVQVDGDLVTAAVESAPGLKAGSTVRLTASAVRRMERLDDADSARQVDRPFRLTFSLSA